jgi:hypothetical protein
MYGLKRSCIYYEITYGGWVVCIVSILYEIEFFSDTAITWRYGYVIIPNLLDFWSIRKVTIM